MKTKKIDQKPRNLRTPLSKPSKGIKRFSVKNNFKYIFQIKVDINCCLKAKKMDERDDCLNPLI